MSLCTPDNVGRSVGATRRSSDVVLVTEGTYPHGHGGVSVWCDQLVQGLPEQRFRVVALTAFSYQRPVWDLPEHVAELVTVGLWDHHRRRPPARRGRGAPLAEALAALLATPHDEVGWFGGFVDTVSGLDPAEVGRQLGFAELVGALDSELARAGRWEALAAARAADLVIVADMLDHLLRPLAVDPGPAAIYHASSNGLAALVAMVGQRRHDARFVLTEHGIYLRERYLELRRLALARPARALLLRFHRLVTATAYAKASAVTPGSRWNVRWEARHGAAGDRVRTIYNGIDPAEFPARDGEPDEPVVAWLGRIDPIKDLETLVTAFAVVKAKRPDARLRLYGRTPTSSRPYRERLDALVADLDLDQAVTFEGGVERSIDAYRGAQVGVLSSISEGFPYSLIEAMASGLPAVATGVGGVDEAVADTGLVVVPRSPELLGEALVELLDDGPRRRELGRQARERVLEHFTLAHCLDGYRRVYAELRTTFRVPPLRVVPPPTADAARPEAPPALEPEPRQELVAALGGPGALVQAVDADEVAATLESVGVTDRVAQHRFGSPDVFHLAERLWRAGGGRVDSPRPARAGPTQSEGALERGLAYVLPALVVAAAVAAGVDQVMLVAASVVAWGLANAGGVLGYTAVHRTPGPPGLAPLRLGLVAAAGIAGVVGLVLARLWSAGLAGGLAAALPVLHLVAATGLVVTGRTRRLLWSLAPVSALSLAVVVVPASPATPWVGPVSVATVAGNLASVMGLARRDQRDRAAADGGPAHRLLERADWVGAAPLAASGWCMATFALLTVSAVGHLPGLGSVDSRQWLLLGAPLWVMVATSEWFFLRLRRRLAAQLEASDTIGRFRAAATRTVAGWTARGGAVLGGTGAVAAGLVGVLSQLPLASGALAAVLFGLVALALYGSTVLIAGSRVGVVLAVTGGAVAALAWVVGTPRNPLDLPDHVAALLIAGAVALGLCLVAGAVLVDPGSHR